MELQKDVITLSKWLVTKGETSLLKIQKILFFLRVEELKNNDIKNTYFDANHNFEAWIYGPVNVKSFKYLQPWFNSLNEVEEYLLNDKEVEEIDKKYQKYYDKYKNFSPNELVDISHKSLAWNNARKGYSDTQICKVLLEEDQIFTTFLE